MLRGIYQATSGLLSDEIWQRVLANNLAQMNTPGYLSETPVLASFGQVLTSVSGGAPIGATSAGAAVFATVPNLQPGPISQTGNPLNAAITGQGFFAVDSPQGTLYTRAGAFSVDQQGYLVTPQGYLVLDQLGAPIRAGQNAQITSAGLVTSGGVQVGKIGVFNPTVSQLTDAGGGFFTATGTVATVANPTLVTGAVEQSNVSPADTLSAMIQVLRHFEAGQQYIHESTTTLDQFIGVAG